MPKTPSRLPKDADLFTPPMKANLRDELKQILMERNRLTAKSKSKVLSIFDDLSSPETSPTKPSDLRRRAINEILDSEKRYIEQLNVLIQYFIKPLQHILDAKNHTALFGQIEMIYNLNRELVVELEKDTNSVAKAFLKLAPFFKLYSVYAFDYKNAILRLQELTTEKPAFKRFLDDTETRPEVQMKLNSLLITPIQRIPRYKLLLNQVQLYTSPSEADYKCLTESIREIENTVQHINSVVEDQEHTQSLINLQNSLVGRQPAIVKPCRRIVREGVLSKVTGHGSSTKYLCVLMSDIFMYCRILKKRNKNTVVENSLQCCCIYPLRKTKVSELFSANFKITCQGDGNIFHAENDQQCRAWVSAIKEIIERNVESRKTLRKESSKKRTVRNKRDIRTFGSEFMLSPPQKGIKYDYENVFRWGDYERKAEKSPITAGTKRKNTESGNGEPARKKRGTFEIIKSWFSRSQPVDPNCSDTTTNSDPTYGFADRTYFRNTIVDESPIPIKVDFKSALRNYQQRLGTVPELEPKRVKFDDAEDVATESWFEAKRTSPPVLPAPPLGGSAGLKARIFEFFSRLT